MGEARFRVGNWWAGGCVMSLRVVGRFFFLPYLAWKLGYRVVYGQLWDGWVLAWGDAYGEDDSYL